MATAPDGRHRSAALRTTLLLRPQVSCKTFGRLRRRSMTPYTLQSSAMRRSLGGVLLLATLWSFCGCSSEVSVPQGEDGDACTALPPVATSLEALALARECVPSADDALVFEYYGAWDENATAPQGEFAEWHFILSIDGVLNNVVFIGSSSTSPNGVIAAHELQPLNGSLPDCGAPGLTVVDSEARTDAAAELFSSLGVNVASAAVYHLSLIHI